METIAQKNTRNSKMAAICIGEVLPLELQGSTQQTKKSTEMFFSHLLLLSSLLAIYAMTTQETEQPDQKLILLPLFGKPHYLYMKSWYWEGNDRQSITSKDSFFQVSIPADEIKQGWSERDPRTIVFGSWKYVEGGDGRPSSALKIAGDETTVHFGDLSYAKFSVRVGEQYDTYLGRLLRQFDKKMISFWWDSKNTHWKYQGPENPIAELAIGGMNPSRFVAGTEMRLQLRFPITSPWYWEPMRSTSVRVGNRDLNWNKKIAFEFVEESNIPTTIYDAITKPLRDEMRYAVGLLKGMPQDINKQIMKYLDFTKPIDEFDCKDGPKLLPLRIGELTISTSMMYQQISPDKCKMTLMRNDDQAQQSEITIGIDLIRHFYFSIIYDSANRDILQFATRVEGDVPLPPMQPPTATSSSGRS